jgi:PAS domain S-box-containing protein
LQVAPRSEPHIRTYGFAFLIFLVAAFVRLALDPWLGKGFPYLLFFPAILVAARYGGFGPGMLVTTLSAAASIVSDRNPHSVFAIAEPVDPSWVLRFALAGAVISGLIHMVRVARSDQWRLAAIVESSDDAIVGKALDGTITSWNRGAERLFGFPAAEAVGQPITLIIPPERLTEEEEVLHKIRTGQRVALFETLRRRKDGSEIEVSIRVSPIVDDAGNIVGASKIARDITDRKRIERQQAELAERQRIANEEAVAARDRLAFLSEVGAALASSLDYEATIDRAVHIALPRLGDYCSVLVATDDDGALRHVAWGHVNRSKERTLRELATRVLQVADAKGIQTFASRVMASGQTIVVPQAQLRETASRSAAPTTMEVADLSDAIRAYAYVGVPLHVRGRVAGVISFGTTEDHSKRDYSDVDVTIVEEFARRVSVAVENARLFRKAEELNRLKDEFLATLSHELRTPLSAVLGWSRMLAAGHLDSEKVKQATEAIERNAQAQAKIVDDILDLARGMGGNLRLDLKRFDLVTVAHRAVEAVAPAALGKHIQIELCAPAAVMIVGDSNRLQQVLWNLMSNALKFTPAGGKVRVDVGLNDGHAELRVTDTGIGIAPSFLPFVFDKFRQADASVTRQQGGLGLGLAIARHLVELHGGAIEARSGGEGSGATFSVRLPLPAGGD